MVKLDKFPNSGFTIDNPITSRARTQSLNEGLTILKPWPLKTANNVFITECKHSLKFLQRKHNTVR